MPFDRLVVVRTFATRVDAEVGRSALEAAGIKSVVRSDDAGGTYPGMLVRGVHLLVPASDVVTAEEILDATAIYAAEELPAEDEPVGARRLNVFLVHHAEAVEASVDPQRPLSSRGLAHAQRIAEAAKAFGALPAVIWHSGKLRSRQTAEVFLRVCNPFAQFKMVRGLRPDDPPDWICEALELEQQDLLLVSHMPLLPDIARRLAAVDRFPLHGVVALERRGPHAYIERWRSA